MTSASTSVLSVGLAVLALSAFLLFNGNTGITLQSSNTIDEVVYKSFLLWKQQYKKNYNGFDEQYRFEVYKQNYIFVEETNKGLEIPTVELNLFADLTNQEFRQRHLGKQYRSEEEMKQNIKIPAFTNANPSSVDWVAKGAVTPVVNQGNCGSCWAFGSVGALEGVYQVATGNLIPLSQQQLVSCNTNNGNEGCNGGLEVQAYAYTQQYGIQTAASYPYTSGTTGLNGKCHYNSSDVVYKNTGYFTLPLRDPVAKEAGLARSPLSAGINGGSIFFQLYNGKSVLNNKGCTAELNHSVTLVGYNNDAQVPYWTIKNSWGNGWGDQGFMRIYKSMEKGIDGVCGIQIEATGPSYQNV